MLLTITYRGENTEDLGYLLFKNPSKTQAFPLPLGKAFVFYPEVSDEITTVALLVDLDPLDLSKGKEGIEKNTGDGSRGLFAYVNDRPYSASSFLSSAISRVFGTAMTGRCDGRPELAGMELDLTAKVFMLPVRGEKQFLNEVFEPLGYDVSFESFPIDEKFPSWGECDCVNLTVRGKKRLSDLLNQLYVLIPVFDMKRHYYVGEEEIQKLLKHGSGWLKDHPEKTRIVRRYFPMAKSYASEALNRLQNENKDGGRAAAEDAEDAAEEEGTEESVLPWSLDRERLGKVRDEVVNSGARSCLDLGCGEGKLLKLLLEIPGMERIAGADVSLSALKKAVERIGYDRLPERKREILSLFQGSAVYQDAHFQGYDCICLAEVIEHMEPEMLPRFEHVVFGYAAPGTVVITTPNRNYNVNYRLEEDELRHGDHRFEWTEKEFHHWAEKVCQKYGYSVKMKPVGAKEPGTLAPTQMGVFTKWK